jgi:hypothetical protein
MSTAANATVEITSFDSGTTFNYSGGAPPGTPSVLSLPSGATGHILFDSALSPLLNGGVVGTNYNANLTLSASSTQSAASALGIDAQGGFSGSLSFTNAASGGYPGIGAGALLETIAFTNAVLAGAAGGNNITLTATNGVQSGTVTITIGSGVTATKITEPEAFTLSLTNLNVPLAIGAAGGFTFTSATDAGNSSATIVPEPAPIALALTGLPVLGLVWARRRRQRA